MIEAVVALLMFVNGEIKEARIQDSMECVLAENVKRNVNIQKQYLTNAGRVKQN